VTAARGLSIASFWGILGFVALLVNAIVRLSPLAIEAIEGGMSPLEWAAMVGYVVFMVYSEGYKGFHRQASPRVVARGLYLANHPTVLRVVLAPAFCMGLFDATRKRLIVSWSILIMIVGLVLLVRQVPQPWRGILDAGVVLGLVLGALSTLYFMVGAMRGLHRGIDPEVSL